MYGVASVSKIDKIIGLFCKRALQKRQYFAKETYNSKEPTNRSHPIAIYVSVQIPCCAVCCSVLQCAVACCSVLQCVAVCCSVLQCVAVCCSVLQCVINTDAVCCSE